MKIIVKELGSDKAPMVFTTSGHEVVIEKAYVGPKFISDSGEHFGVCMRDSGFEFCYEGMWYSAQNGSVTFLRKEVALNETNTNISMH